MSSGSCRSSLRRPLEIFLGERGKEKKERSENERKGCRGSFEKRVRGSWRKGREGKNQGELEFSGENREFEREDRAFF